MKALLSPSAAFGSFGAGLASPLIDGGALKGTLDLARGRDLEDLQDYRKAVVQSLVDVENALIAVQQNTEHEKRLTAVVASSRLAYEISKVRLREGTIDIVTVLNTEQTLFGAQDALAVVRFARFTALSSLAQAIGGGWTRPDTLELPPLDGLAPVPAEAVHPDPVPVTGPRHECGRLHRRGRKRLPCAEPAHEAFSGAGPHPGDRGHDRGRALPARACAGTLAARQSPASRPHRRRRTAPEAEAGGERGAGKRRFGADGPISGADETRRHRRRPDHGRCARHRPGHEQRHGEEPGRRQAHRDRLPGRPGRQERRPHRPHRSRDLQGALRQCRGQEGAGRGPARQRAGGSRALPETGRDPIRLAPAGRHPESTRGAIYRAAGAGSGLDRRHQGHVGLCDDPLSRSTGEPASGSWTRATSSTPAIRPAS